MGQLLSEPITTKESSSIDTELYRVGSSSMQGWRVSILSYRVIIPSTHTVPSLCVCEPRDYVEEGPLNICVLVGTRGVCVCVGWLCTDLLQ